MESYSSINPLLLSQPDCIEAIKNLNHQKEVKNDAFLLKKASQDFESILVNFVISAMWKTVPKSDLFEENAGGMDTYTEIMHTALAQDIAAKGGIGVASIIYKRLMQDKELTERSPISPLVNRDNSVIDLTKNDKAESAHSKDGKI